MGREEKGSGLAVAVSVSLAMWDPGLEHQSPALEALATAALEADN